MKILFKFASRSRPEKFFLHLDNIYIHTREKDFTIIASLDIDDTSMNNEDVISKMKIYPHLYPAWGFSKGKIDAVNRDMDKVGEWDILINTSDDMVFTEEGFDVEIKKDMEENFPSLDGVLHYNDGNQKDNVMTMSIMGKKYFELSGYIYNPEYISLWCDAEATEVAYMLKKYKYMGDDKILFRHFHPAWGMAQWDEQYKKTESQSLWALDKDTIDRRRAINYGLKSEEIKNDFKYKSL